MGYDMSTNTFESLVAPPASCSCMETGMPTANPNCDGTTAFAIGFDKFGSCNAVTDTPNCDATCSGYNKNLMGNGGDFTNFAAKGTPTPTGGTCANPAPSMGKQPPTSDQGRY